MATAVMFESERQAWVATPEIYFSKHIDNSRLVKVSDPQRQREMTNFVRALVIVFAAVMFYAWQHFSAIEYGYRIEALKSQREVLIETNRQLKLEEAYLRNPERIVLAAQNLGLQTPAVGQVLQLDTPAASDGGPVMAQVAAVTVISGN